MLAPLLLSAALTTGTPVAVDAALLDGLPRAEAMLSVHGETHRCTGPALTAVLARLGLPQGEDLRGPHLASGVRLRARDGYAVLFSLGELDPTLGQEAAIIATACDGKALDAATGPYRLVVPGDKRPARAMRQLASIELVLP
ncbi:MAG: hypothetical protein JSR96_15780 [Proteobacteria bacterium]|nr:hypothetical protein [Pseudomonadota bacterium]